MNEMTILDCYTDVCIEVLDPGTIFAVLIACRGDAISEEMKKKTFSAELEPADEVKYLSTMEEVIADYIKHIYIWGNGMGFKV